MRKRLGATARLLAVAVGALFLCYVTARFVLGYQIRRGSQMLAIVQNMNVGESEDSIRPLLRRFDSYRWDVQLGAHEDYNYVLEINPWRFPTVSGSKSGRREHAIGRDWNPRLRRAIGLRQWVVTSEIAVKQQRVVAVQTETVVEGKSMWLGAMWRLSEKPREFERDAISLDSSSAVSQYLATPGILNMESGTGTSWSIWTTPSSPKGQRQMANKLNYGCLRSLSGCDSVCELLTEASRFFNERPDLAPRGGGWDDSSRTCIKPDLRENRYW
jgi:hypothetical protein